MRAVTSARGVLSIRWVATTIAIALTVGTALAASFVSERNARMTLSEEIEARLRLQARSLAASSTSALLGDYPELTLHPLVRGMRERQPELEPVVVVDHQNRIQGHSDARLLGTTFEPPPGLASPAELDPRSRAAFLHEAGSLVVARSPIYQPNGQVIGAVYVGVPRAYIDGMVSAARPDQAFLLSLLVAVAATCAFVVMSQLLRPIGALRAGLERIGRGDLDTPIGLRHHTELGLLAGAVDDMALTLKQAQAEMLERERLSHEVELARELQRSLLPSCTTTAGPFMIRGDHRAAAEVGGDYWDVLPLPDGRIGLAVADVAGKGLAGCLVMSMLSALLRAFRATHPSPSAMLAELDERLSESLRPGVFVTMWYGVLDPPTGRLTFASAGHNPLVVWRKNGGHIVLHASKGIPLGAVRGGAIRATLREETIELEPGDLCVQYTDGYTEAFRDGGDETFGIERVGRTVAAQAGTGGEAVLGALREAVREWAGDGVPDDDETLLVLACDPAAPPFTRGAPMKTADQAELGEALDCLGRAERSDAGLHLPARLDALHALDDWVTAIPTFDALAPADVEVLRAALYEACANIVEHGCDDDGRHALDVWWLPDHATNGHVHGCGRFVLRDDGRPFRLLERRPTDFRDPVVRARGRGIGLEIIHRAVDRIAYHPATGRGNVTVLVVGPRDGHAGEEERAA